MLITTRQKLQNMQITSLQLNGSGSSIENVTDHKVLGIIIDQNLTWNHHVDMLTKLKLKKFINSPK